jgi:outer membrane protein assembly factor BamB
MVRSTLAFLVAVCLAACGGDVISNARNPQSISVLTQHNDNTRAGWNDHETALTTSNVNQQHFGKVSTLAVDDQVYAQPLVVGHVHIKGGDHNVVYVATVNNTLYAFDGDDGTLYWVRNITAPGLRPPRNTDMTGACGGTYTDFSGNIGIVGTPVIDAARQVLYVVARSTDGNAYTQHLHAVSLIDGNETPGSPVPITATTPGSGDGSVNNVITFNGQTQNQRQGLTLANGVVYVTFSSHCDWGPYHGWILGYDAGTLQQRVVYNATPNGYGGGMWESGAGMAADAAGNLYIVVGNGTVGDSIDPTNLINRGTSALKLTPSGATLQVASWFTPTDYQFINNNDLDYGSIGSILIPNTNYLLTGGKDGNLYLLNKDAMGDYQPSSNQVQQVVQLTSSEMHCQPAYYQGSATEFLYVWPENNPLRAIPYNRGTNQLDPLAAVTFTAGGPTGHSGAMLSGSSDGTKAGTAILWATYAFSGDAEHDVSIGVLRAFDATDVTRELWNSRQNLSRDGAGMYAKFAAPTIANGRVYLPTFSNQVVVYGLQ